MLRALGRPSGWWFGDTAVAKVRRRTRSPTTFADEMVTLRAGPCGPGHAAMILRCAAAVFLGGYYGVRFSLAGPGETARHGGSPSQQDSVALVALALALSTIATLLRTVQGISRAIEHDADIYGHRGGSAWHCRLNPGRRWGNGASRRWAKIRWTGSYAAPAVLVWGSRHPPVDAVSRRGVR